MKLAVVFALVATGAAAQVFELGEAIRRELPKDSRPPAATADFAIPATWYDTSNRAAVAQAYISDYLPTRSVPSSWTGNVAAGNPGATSDVYRSTVIQRLNWYRAMSGVPASVSLNATYNAKAQKGALMLAANNALTHNAPTNWQFYTADGAEALANSNVCQGSEADPGCIEQYIADQDTAAQPGINAAVGHRRWMLYPQTTQMGTGDVPYAPNLWNSLWVMDGNYGSTRPNTREEFVAWPPKGYVPYQVVFPRWSFSLPNANFSGATVAMTRNGTTIPVRAEMVFTGVGENSVVWVPDNQSTADWLVLNPPSVDTTYNVTISNVVVGGQPRSYSYEVIVFDPGAGPVFTADPPVSSFPAGGDDEVQLRILKDPPSVSASAVPSASWITMLGSPITEPSGTYYFYRVAPNTGAARTGTITIGNAIHTVHQAGSGLNGLSVSRTSVPFGAIAGSTTQYSGAQELQVTLTGTGAATATWTATSNQPWLSLSPASATGSGKLVLSLKPSALPASGTHTATVTVTAAGADGSPKTIAVPLRMIARTASAEPFGTVDTPEHGKTNLYGAIGVTGWALDDTEVIRISLWRNPLTGEPTHPNGHVYIGDAVFLEGARLDVGQVFPTYPMGPRAGWGVQVLTNMLPNTNGQPGTGNGTYTFYVYAHDHEGKTKLLGSPTVSVNNAVSAKPFGTLDTPGNGQEVSGTITVFGWALTPQPGLIPTNGSTIIVYVDGVSQGPVNGYNQFRPDIANLFPGYNNSNGAVGYYYLDTTKLTDGLHNIAWSVTDNLGRVEGIGSRLFWVRNSGTPGNAQAEANEAAKRE